ncbi:MAG: acetoin utilization protein AcuC [Actinomycetota bacterium]
MRDQVELIWYGSGAPWYDFGPQHPLRPGRITLTHDLIESLGIVDGDRVVQTDARSATDEEILAVHAPEYVQAVKAAGNGERGPWWEFGFGPGDNPAFPHMHEAAARVAGASITAAEAVHSGRALHAFNPSGGLHHAARRRASGFCVYDDPAVAIAWLLGRGVEKVAYVDVDAHHGDGPQGIFYDEPRVLTISLHQSGATLFPGTGFVGEIGEGPAAGTSVNVPLPPLTDDVMWLKAFDAVVPPLLRSFQPEVLVTQLGCDTHYSDPLTNLGLSTRAFGGTAERLHSLAHETAGGRWLATGGGGYQWATVVPRAWTIYFAEMAGFELPDRLPQSWVDRASDQSHQKVPQVLDDPAIDGGLVSEEAIDEVVDEVREAVFGYHGIISRPG